MIIFLLEVFGAFLMNFLMLLMPLILVGDFGGHSSSIMGGILELNLFTFGLPLIIPTIVFFVIGFFYQAKKIQRGEKINWVYCMALQLGVACALGISWGTLTALL